MSPYLKPTPPGRTREALSAHLARKLGWSGRTAATLLNPLSDDEIVRCLRLDAEATRAALFERAAEIMGEAVTRQAFAASGEADAAGYALSDHGFRDRAPLAAA